MTQVVAGQATGRRVLGIPVSRARLLQWREWLMPREQPYVMTRSDAQRLGLVPAPERITQESQGSFMLYGIEDSTVCWLSQEDARRLPRDILRAQPGEHHWPTSDVERDLRTAIAYVREGRHDSRHAEIGDSRWQQIESVLPGSRRIAGTFPHGSGGNCFAAVMAAAGVEGAETEWMQRDPFEAWLDRSTRALPARDRCNDLGVVYVWRRGGLVDHSAVSLGEGYALHKPSDGWMSPTKVLTTREVIASARVTGRHLTRHRLATSTSRR